MRMPSQPSPVAQLVQVVLVHAEVVTDLVEHGGTDLLDQALLVVARKLDIFLKDVDDVRKSPVVLDAALRARAAVVEAQQQMARAEAEALELVHRRAVADLDRDFLQRQRELRRQLGQRLLDQLREARFAHVIRHGIIPRPFRVVVLVVVTYVPILSTNGSLMRRTLCVMSLLLAMAGGCSMP